jgi:hypothetical protein
VSALPKLAKECFFIAPILANQPIGITIPALPAQPGLVTSSQLRLCRLPIHHIAALLTFPTPADRLAITLDPEPAALPSTRNRPRTAVRRGAAWPPAERPSG